MTEVLEAIVQSEDEIKMTNEKTGRLSPVVHRFFAHLLPKTEHFPPHTSDKDENGDNDEGEDKADLPPVL
ncbi:TPA: hypothetical protein I7680_11395 [Vibrio vulnificus]|nr:hypothetical protein [Vibrio vulnificus]NVC73218.1 hypothetical protein [Vibrio vulnificus]RZP61395.1 hypothetical protein D8T47_11075 [Vibrio vulnificus]RZQ11456.1 hypothetical protein D8T50_20575 [Vibrio vulnificus]HAS8172090.1 hypothetical protein [Vibrio vulnificus]